MEIEILTKVVLISIAIVAVYLAFQPKFKINSILISVIISLLIASVITYAIWSFDKPQLKPLTPTFTMTISPTEGRFVLAFTTIPGYFSSIIEEYH